MILLVTFATEFFFVRWLKQGVAALFQPSYKYYLAQFLTVLLATFKTWFSLAGQLKQGVATLCFDQNYKLS